MTSTDWRKPCPDGCTCGKHKRRTQVHPENCQCGVHGGRETRKVVKVDQHCEPGCICSRHKPSWNTYTPEERAAARERNLAKGREYAKRRRASDPEFVKRERERNKVHGRKYWLKHKFGLTIEAWDAMLIEQSGRCYLCEDPLTATDVHVDHDRGCCPHPKSCGRCIRGLACRWCNQGLGQFRDDPERLVRVAQNLKEAIQRVQLAARP